MARIDIFPWETPEEEPIANKDRRIFHRFVLQGINVRFLKLNTQQDLADGSQADSSTWRMGVSFERVRLMGLARILRLEASLNSHI